MMEMPLGWRIFKRFFKGYELQKEGDIMLDLMKEMANSLEEIRTHRGRYLETRRCPTCDSSFIADEMIKKFKEWNG